MVEQEQLTNELLKKNFTDNFSMAQFIINVARHLIKSGHEVHVPNLLRDIQKNPQLYTAEQLSSEEPKEDTSEVFE